MFREQTQGLTRIVPTVAGQRAYARMVSAVRTGYLHFRIRATVTLAGGPQTAMRNAGSLWSLVDFIGIEENGKDRVNIPGTFLRVLAEMASARTLSAVRITNYANGAYVLEESATLPLAWPLAVRPYDTVFMQRDPAATCQVFAVFNTIAAGLATSLGDAGTATISGLSLDCEQVYDDSLGIKPFFIPNIRMISEPITGAVTGFPVRLLTTKHLRAAIIGQLASVVGEVQDVINALVLRSDERSIIGDRPVDFENLVCDAEREFGGNIRNHGFDGSAAATQPVGNTYLPLNFQRQGQLGEVINPLRDVNFRAEIEGQASVTAGAGTSRVQVLLYELERVRGLTAGALPFDA
jgi:hypothetical protein